MKYFIVIICYVFIYVLIVLITSNGKEYYYDTAVVVGFTSKPVFSGFGKYTMEYPVVLTIYEGDSFYFSKNEWTYFIGLNIGDQLKAKHIVIQEFSEENLERINNFLDTLPDAVKELYSNIPGELDRVSSDDLNFNISKTQTVLKDIELYSEFNRWISWNKLVIHSFLLFVILLLVLLKII